MASRRMTIMSTRHLILAGHNLAAYAGFEIQEAGGNAMEAGVAPGIAIGVLHGGADLRRLDYGLRW